VQRFQKETEPQARITLCDVGRKGLTEEGYWRYRSAVMLSEAFIELESSGKEEHLFGEQCGNDR
jgi:hypothetical protein